MKSRRIVVVGSSNTDMIVQLERIPRPGEALLGGDFAMAAGGKAPRVRGFRVKARGTTAGARSRCF